MAEGWQSRTIALGWPDGRGGEFDLSVELALIEARWVCVGLRLGYPAGVTPPGLRTADLRGLSMPAIVAVAYEQFRDELDQAAAEELAARRPAPGSRLEYRQQLLAERRRQEALRAKGPRRAGRPPLSVAHLQEVAEVYAQAYAEQRPPRKAVAAYFAISPTAAASRIARARQAGLLGLSGRGRAGPVL